MKVVAIIQARMGSTRLPGKILKEVNGKTLLEYQIERVQRSSNINEIIVATTTNETDEPIVRLCRNLGIACYRGSEQDVLGRYFEAATDYGANVVVRLTSDCPLIDPVIIDDVIQYYQSNQDLLDYCSNTIKRTFPRGLDVEVFSYEALENAHENAILDRDREHVTAYIYTNPAQFNLDGIEYKQDLSHYRWTVDTIEDLELIDKIIDALYPLNKEFLLQNVLNLLIENPSWNEINANVEQKKL